MWPEHFLGGGVVFSRVSVANGWLLSKLLKDYPLIFKYTKSSVGVEVVTFVSRYDVRWVSKNIFNLK